MKVEKRNGRREEVNLNKITNRIKKLKFIDGIDDKKLNIDHHQVAAKVVTGLYDGVTTRELDNLAAETAAAMVTVHPDYGKLAARIEVSALHKETEDTLFKKMHILYQEGVLSEEFFTTVMEPSLIEALDNTIDYSRDYLIDYFGIKTLKRSYLLKGKEGNIVERPQDMWMRVAAFIHQDDVKKAIETYNLMSTKHFTHATPTLFNAGTTKPQLSSCFLLDMDSDSIRGIYKTLADCAAISQSAGGIGLATSKIRSKGSHIAGTNGTSNGLVPMLRVFDATARYVDQGGGKRKGAIAMYLEPWHADIFEFLDLKKNHGKEEMRARDLFYAMWIPDLFMERVREDGDWTLFDPKSVSKNPTNGDDTARPLQELYGREFSARYTALEESGKGVRRVRARDLFNKILESQIETGTPYMLYKDAINEKCNQKNLGTIKSSNLCTEITEFTSQDEVAVCNLASISLPSCLADGEHGFDYDLLYKLSYIVTVNLNKVIDLNYYPVPEAKASNMKHRPIGIGVQGLADVYAALKLPFDGEKAKRINKRIFEVIYKGAVDASCALAKSDGAYETIEGSPISNGEFQFDLWGLDRSELFLEWEDTFKAVAAHGLRNSLLLAPMPTASTSQILGNNEAFEPFTSNLYTRRTSSGEFVVINKWLVEELLELGLWSSTIKDEIVAQNGSIQLIAGIPDDIKHRYRTVWEMSMKDIIDMAADRGPFICQSQSMNLFMQDATKSKLSSMHFYAWEQGLKTGMYYLRTKSATDAIKFTIVKQDIPENDKEGEAASDFDCIGCGS